MTTWVGWAVRRAASSRFLVAMLLALVTATTAILAFVVGHASTLATDSARAALASAEPGAGAIQAQTRMGDDTAAQDTTARTRLAEGFAPAPVVINTTFVSEPRRATTDDGDLEQRITLWAGAHLSPGELSVTDGTWPAAADDAALHASAAEHLGLRVGDTLTVDDHGLQITALWEATEPTSPLWFGDPLLTDGADPTSVGPLVVDPSVLTGGAPFIRWSVAPDADRITPEQLDVLTDGAERAKALVAEADLTGRGIVVEGDLAATAERAARDWQIGETFGIVPVSVLLLVAVVGLVQVSGLLAATRQREHELLAARGAGRRQLLVAGVAEAGVVAMVGAVLGTSMALAILWLVSSSTSHFDRVILGGAGSLLLALIAMWSVAIRSTSSLTGRHRADRVRAAAGAALLVVIAAAAAVTAWQLRSTPELTLLPALAPALLLATAAALGLVVLGPLTRVIERASRLGSTASWLAGAQLARGLLIHAVPVTLTILATGTATLASLHAGTAAATHRDATLLAAGAPLRATLSSLAADNQGLALPDLTSVAGITTALPVWLDDSAHLGDIPLSAMAAPLDQLDAVATLPSGLGLPQLPPPAPAAQPIAVPQKASTLSIEVAGRIVEDPWQREATQRASEFNLFRAGDQPGAELLAEAWTADHFRALTEPMDISTRLMVRDLTTGLSRTIAGPTLQLPGPVVTWDDGYTNVAFTPSEASSHRDVALPTGGNLAVESVQITGPEWEWGIRTLELDFTLLADGVALPGAEQWVSDQAVGYEVAEEYRQALAEVDPAWEMVEEEFNGPDGLETAFFPTPNKPLVPEAFLDTREPTWHLSASPAQGVLTVGPTVAFTGHDPLSVMAGHSPPAPEPVPVALTEPLADASTLAVGSSFELAAFGRRVPAVVAAVTPALPGLTTANGAIADSRSVSAYLATTSSPLRWPSEMWASLGEDPGAARVQAAQLPGVSAVSTLDDGASTSATTSGSLWIAAGSALVLSLTGLASAAATQLTARRSEVAVLRALGMTPPAQARSRIVETGVLLAMATAAGIGAGVGVASLVVHPLIAASVDEAQGYHSDLTAELPPWAILLLSGAAVVTVILAWVGRAVQKQARDAEYREEVR